MNFKAIKEAVNNREPDQMCDRVMARIEGEDIKPCPKWQFVCIHYGVWLLWVSAVVMGAVAVAVMLYVGTHARFALFEATHETSLSFFIEVLPYLWLAVLFLMLIFAYFNLRQTKRGYRYPVTNIFLSSIVFSLFGGLILHIFGVGYSIDHALSMGMPLYPSMEKKEETLWQKPLAGRLLGSWQGTEDNMMFYQFTDTEGAVWSVATAELREKDIALLETKEKVRLLGTTTDQAKRQFHACGVFPWMMEKEIGRAEMVENRLRFIERMNEHVETAGRLKKLEAEIYTDKPLNGKPFMEGLCSDIAAVKRVMFVSSRQNSNPQP